MCIVRAERPCTPPLFSVKGATRENGLGFGPAKPRRPLCFKFGRFLDPTCCSIINTLKQWYALFRFLPCLYLLSFTILVQTQKGVYMSFLKFMMNEDIFYPDLRRNLGVR